MSDIKNDPDLRPSDHVLDAFLHELGAATTWDHARKFLADMREAFAREELAPRPVIDRAAVIKAITGVKLRGSHEHLTIARSAPIVDAVMELVNGTES